MKHLRIAAFALVAAWARFVLFDRVMPGPSQFKELLLSAAIFMVVGEGILFFHRARGFTTAQRRTGGWQYMFIILSLIVIGTLSGVVGKVLHAALPMLHFHLLPTLIGVVVGAIWFTTVWRAYKALYPYMESATQMPFEVSSPFLVVLMAMLAGFSEELIFRGFLLFTLGIWLSSLIFAALHIYPTFRSIPRTRQQWLGTSFYLTKLVVAGLVYSSLVLHFRSLWPAIAAHTSVDLIGLTIMWRRYRSSDAGARAEATSKVSPGN